ncbi:acyl-CoA dehydrogenase family protein [Jiella pelagia]|uniref:Acyl-CoA/acyl-ACP dehydrogenase n=1 Tax=Jiella pelagia TaxID=2986949 RepID=A0ABY7C0Q1_9HYPH|nr:acyl-CoA dehydrogenase family protein [Jiella pelagia]WAP68796.1 acyl-CoA/acyl-ACP dehydrogenase [Jiella pelagia]
MSHSPTVAGGLDYQPFETAFAEARQAGLFREVGGFYDGAGRLDDRWPVLLGRLAEAGGRNLNLGRLLEGHANAVQLVRLYGDESQKACLDVALEHDRILGVWGADGAPPASVDECPDGVTLGGSKRYASGLGTVSLALVPIVDADGLQQLYFVTADEPFRQDVSTWRMNGMQESASGSFSLEGIAADATTRLGRPGDYRIEPFFEGGIWRCAAVHVGAIETIVAVVARHLDRSGRLDHPLQAERLGHAVMHARTARLWVKDAARRIEAPQTAETIPEAVATASYTRLQVERDALAVMELARRSVGLPSFAAGHPLDRVVADLSVYLRQANPDALLLNKCRAMAEEFL